MKSAALSLAAGLLLSFSLTAAATTLYVDVNNSFPAPPFTNWVTAATDIQAAVDAAQEGDTVVVTNGVYATGGRAMYGTMSNRVVVDKPIIVISVNGPELTSITGYQVPEMTNGDGAIRCVYLADGAVLSGFTITNGATCSWGDYSNEQSGGGVWCESSTALVTNCTLTGNAAYDYGGGAYDGTLMNCTLTGNSAGSLGGGASASTLDNCTLTGNWAGSGGGAYYSTLNNCMLTGNSAQDGGGVYDSTLNDCMLTANSAGSYGGGASASTLNNCTLTGNSAGLCGGGAESCALNNCILYYNTGNSGPNYDANSILDYCCTTPLPGAGSGNTNAEPQLASPSRLSANSPCRGAGSAAYSTGVDIDGEAWLNPPSIGCDEYVAGAATGPLTVAITTSWTNVGVGFAVDLTGWISGRAAASAWDFMDGTVLSNRPYASHVWNTAGEYPVEVRAYNDSHPEGVSATVTIRVVGPYYVSVASATPVPPYSSWETAARTIQEAVDVTTVQGALVLVTNGVYASGGRAEYGTLTNRVAVDRPVVVRSVNGPAVTVIQGYQVPGTTNGDGAIRCVLLANGAGLSGFTLTNGATRVSGFDYNDKSGGGLWSDSTNLVVSNCVFAGNSASSGGGAYQAWLINCTLIGNSARNGGGAYSSTLTNCSLTGNSAGSGGGTYASMLYNCTLAGNSATNGGGAYSSTLTNCAVAGNFANLGGGTYASMLNNCTLSGNSATNGGGSYSGTLMNCIVYFNNAATGTNYSGGSFSYCCTTPKPTSGTDNLVSDPQLAGAFHISSDSPCRRAGSPNYAVGVDIDGEPWANPPSIGCDEYCAGAVTGPLNVAILASPTNTAVGFPVNFSALMSGRLSASVWNFGDGVVLSNRIYAASHAWAAPRDYPVVLTAYNDDHADGVSSTVTVHVVDQVIHYVSQSGTNPVPPYITWATAATNIQEAIDAVYTSPKAVVLVSNGVYALGGRAVVGTMTNRVVVSKPITLLSVNGPGFTVIKGSQVPGTTNGDGAIRCVYLTNGALLSGFTLTNGATRGTGASSLEGTGGGVWCASTGAVVSNCVLACNSAINGGGAYSNTLKNCVIIGNSATSGGGTYSSTLNNCALTGNTAISGGGSYSSTLNNCTITGNSAASGGGTYLGTLRNCIVYFNNGDSTSNHYGGTLNYCCTAPQPVSGTSNLVSDPQLASAFHISVGSPCRGVGSTNYAAGVDIDGEAWANPPSIGCDEYWAGTVTGPLGVAIVCSPANMTVAGFPANFSALISGRASANAWDFGNGVVLSNSPYATHAWDALGDYPVVLTAYNGDHPDGVSSTVTVHVVEQVIHYVSQTSTNPVSPYVSWATAATNIQAAIDAVYTSPKAIVLVSNGVYEVGGRWAYGGTNRVVVDKPITLQSLNGPGLTVIKGSAAYGNGAIRCVYLTNGAVLSGLSLTNGAGGGVYCASTNATVSNCVLGGNWAHMAGGGAYQGTFINCTFVGNSAPGGGGAYLSILYNCTLMANSASDGSGGGALYSTLNNCTLAGNAAGSGGGASCSTLNNCTLTGNSAQEGGGADSCTLNNCTLTGNSAQDGGGAFSDALNNCILYYNTATNGPNYDTSSILNYCCTTPLPDSGFGNISAEPQLASASHLSAGSPCRGAGSAAYEAGVDIDGESWLNPPSIGCDEYRAGTVTGPLTVAIGVSRTNAAVEFSVDLTGWINGRVADSVWDFRDGMVLSNRLYVSHAWSTAGDYPVVLRAFNESYPEGVSATVTIRVVGPYLVSAASANPVPPFSSWETAARTIQEAVDVTLPGALVLVTNGVYATGGRAVYGTMTNRVAVDKPVRVESINGPAVTVIQGYQVPGTTNGDGATRCVYLTDGSVLSGFTLTNGATRASGVFDSEQSGGGVWCQSSAALVTNCTLTGNSACYYGGGAYEGTLNKCTVMGNSAQYGGGAVGGELHNCTLIGNSAQNCGGALGSTLNNCTLTGNLAGQYGGGVTSCTLNNCMLTGNSARSYGGGASDGTLNNCTLTGNSAGSYGGGASGGTLNNCILYYNTAYSGPNYDSTTLNYCCTTPLPGGGSRNTDAEPQLASAYRLSAGSPCRRAGSAAYAVGVDIDGEAWLNPPSIGCDEYWAGAVTGALAVAISESWTNVVVGYAMDLAGRISGRVETSVWDFRDGTVLSNRPYASHAWGAAGDYPVVLWAYNESHPEGVSATVTIRVVAPLNYVSATSTNPVPPYISWETAARTIQEAVDVTVPGGLVRVNDGVYATGGRAVYGTMTNRVAVDKPVRVASINGPAVTVIQGYRVPGTTNGDGAIRCVYLTNGAVLSGFTLTNGATRASGVPYGDGGGGVWCESSTALVTNCMLTGNSASYCGGGAYNGTLKNCTLTGNLAQYGGGAMYGTLNNCALRGNSAQDGGGAYVGTLDNCMLTGNSAGLRGGGAYVCTLNNCALTSNWASESGGGAEGCTLDNCTLTGNSAYWGGGAFLGTLNNCILYYNMGSGWPNNYQDDGFNLILINFCCTTPLPGTGTGNFTNAPLLVDQAGGNLRLLANSPCINTGGNAYAPGLTDLDGNLRIAGGRVDIGAYEYQGTGLSDFTAWLWQYGLPTDGSSDYADTDNDGMNNWEEWLAGTNPTNAASVLRLQLAVIQPAGVTLTWSSVTNRAYFIERATELALPSSFSLLQTNIPGLPDTTSFTDSNPSVSGPAFYRVGVQP